MAKAAERNDELIISALLSNPTVKKAVAFQLAALWSVVSGLNIRLRT